MNTKSVKGSKILLESKIATDFYKKIYDKWPNLIKNKKVILFLPCASTKPTHLSRTHCMMSDVSRIYSESLLTVIISEALVFQPYFEESFPNYEYSPEDLLESQKEMQIMLTRLRSFKNSTPGEKILFYCGGKHHLNLLKMAGFENVQSFLYGSGGVMDGKRIAQECYNSMKSLLDPPVYRVSISCDHIDRERVLISHRIVKRLI